MKIGWIRYPKKLYESKKIAQGGSEIANQYVIDYLRSEGNEISEFMPERIELIDIPALGTPLMFQDLIKRIDELNNCDIIITTNWFGSIFPELKVPLLTIFHSDAQLVLRNLDAESVDNKVLLEKWLKKLREYGLASKTHQNLHDNIISLGENYLGKHSAKIVAVSEFLKNNLMSDYHFNPDNISVIYNTYPREWENNYESKNFNAKKLNLTCVTRMPVDEAGIISKGIDRLFEILKNSSETENTLLASTKPQLYQKFLQNEVPDVDFIENAPRDEVKKNFIKSHISIHPSRCESFGLTLVESMLLGNVVITFPTGVAEELIQSGKNGFIVQRTNEIKEIIKKLNENRKMAQNIAESARQTVLENCSINKIGKKYEELIAEVSGGKKN